MHADIVIDNVLEAHCYVFDKYELIHSRINNNLFAGSFAALTVVSCVQNSEGSCSCS